MISPDWPDCTRRIHASCDVANLPSDFGMVRVARFPIWWQPMQPLFFIALSQSAWVSFALVVLAAALAIYWSMRFVRVVFPPQVSAKGVVLYEAASNLRVRTLFGEKDFDPSRLTLRGVVLTGEVNSVNQGMALIEVDGKPAETLELGDMMAPGIRLEKISPEGVMIRYQGRSYELQQSTMNR